MIALRMRKSQEYFPGPNIRNMTHAMRQERASILNDAFMADATAKAPKPNVGTSIAILVSIPKASIVPVTISMMAKAWGMKRDPGGIDCPEIIRHPEVMSMAAMPHLTRRRARPFRFDFIEAVAKKRSAAVWFPSPDFLSAYCDMYVF